MQMQPCCAGMTCCSPLPGILSAPRDFRVGDAGKPQAVALLGWGIQAAEPRKGTSSGEVVLGRALSTRQPPAEAGQHWCRAATRPLG